ncbi:L-serine ammonia-lyase [Citricoccus sp. NR2]|uniref:L-serine ammonia-lyase n=1 Tax=Citricoccus sp. NR2 TaxID=3004095 RepID=UPI0022DD34B4|nr:L-serine ammonia-lyase [Citricoccus sp. NR2]WBL18971.1 L-serine ammonia-lyase [Citricoccus sp. NR2]
MTLSVLDLFSIGIGPSSSHTVGPMRAARLFVDELRDRGLVAQVQRVKAELYGSLSATGVGHGSDHAVILGLLGLQPESIDADAAQGTVEQVIYSRELNLGGEKVLAFRRDKDLILHMRKSLPGHPNGMRITAYDEAKVELHSREYYSVGGGFVVTAEELAAADGDERTTGGSGVEEPYPFTTADELLEICEREELSIAQVMLANELAQHTEDYLRSQILGIWSVMQECVENGCTREETILPGGLKVRRRAPELRRRLREQEELGVTKDALWALEWVNLYALAVNEENASGGRIVTAPTNGAAGIIPAVLHYYTRFVHDGEVGSAEQDDAVVEYFLTAGAIGKLYKLNASISGADVGCQGEVGSACSMAAGALCAVLGGSPRQVENAAEIGLEHNLGLTCDPVGGLVQVPCIERNAIASVKAINGARLSMHGDGEHRVTLDQAIKTMRDTGKDMKSKYKETSRGGLAVNVVEC